MVRQDVSPLIHILYVSNFVSNGTHVALLSNYCRGAVINEAIGCDVQLAQA